MFKPKSKAPFVSMDMLDDPSFLFDKNGVFYICNEIAEDFLFDMGFMLTTLPKNLVDFKFLFKAHFNMNEKNRFFHENWHFKLCETKSEHGTLIRLTSVRRSESITRLSMSLNIMPWGIITINLDDKQKIVYCNPKAGEFLDVAYQNLIGFSFQDVMNVFGVTEDISRYIYEKESSSYIHSIKINDQYTWTKFYFHPFIGDYRYCMIVLHDITEEKLKESHFSQAQRLESLGQLAGGVAHDFNNILSVIDGYARMSKKDIQDNIKNQYMDNISRAVERGAGLTNKLLTFGRHKVLKETILDLGQLVKDQMPLITPLMDASISLTIDVEKDVFVNVSSDNISQILFNLCINARDAMAGGGNLIVEVRKTKNNFAMLQIIDTGCGIPQEIKAKIFDPFFTTKDAGKGTGLGLSMVYGLVKDMKGHIEVLSKEGSGTSMQIMLPLSLDKPKTADKFLPDESTGGFDGITAMVAEDEPELLSIVSSMMEDIGIKVLRANSGDEALALQEEYEGDIDILLTDVVMPDLNGARLAEMFTACRPESKVMFMSGYPATGQMARVVLPKDALLMPKPINFENLKKVVLSLSSQGNDNSKIDMKNLLGEWRIAE